LPSEAFLNGRIALVILTYRYPEITLRCLASLSGSTEENLTLFLVDNAPEEKSTEILRTGLIATGMDYRYIASSENRGFGDGMNLGMRAALSEGFSHIAILNNDAWVAPDFGQRLREAVARNPGDVLAGLVLEPETNRPTYNIGRIAPWTLEVRHTFHTSQDTPFDFVSGCFTVFPADVLRRAGPFRDDYFLYAEDTELCLRLKKAGVRIRLCPSIVLFHRHGSSADPSGLPKRYYLVRNHAHLVFLHGSAGQKTVFLLYTLVVIISQVMTPHNFFQILAGLHDALRGRMGRRIKAIPGTGKGR
jgi:GT2 family glycosyltransferase